MGGIFGGGASAPAVTPAPARAPEMTESETAEVVLGEDTTRSKRKLSKPKGMSAPSVTGTVSLGGTGGGTGLRV